MEGVRIQWVGLNLHTPVAITPARLARPELKAAAMLDPPPAGGDGGRQPCPASFREIAFYPSRTIAFVGRRSCDPRRRD
jgi:hypothetical protein